MKQTIDNLAKQITRKSSRQTFLTIKLLVSQTLASDCYKAYAYFRWLDDNVDTEISSKRKRLKFISREKLLIDKAYKGEAVLPKKDEEKFIISVINNDLTTNPKLESFIRNFFAIIEFDAKRKGDVINRKDFIWYTKTLGMAVTDGIEYFIGKDNKYPDSPYHYSAAIAAHITHILRDFHEDIKQGYFNIPKEDIKENNTEWIKNQVNKARTYFKKGKEYINTLSSFRVKLVALWYCDRFEWILTTIENDNFKLRENYFEKKHFLSLFYYFSTFVTLSIKHYFKI